MEGNFLSRYKNKLDNWTRLIEEEPHNKKRYESEMSDYIIKCMPYMKLYIEEGKLHYTALLGLSDNQSELILESVIIKFVDLLYLTCLTALMIR